MEKTGKAIFQKPRNSPLTLGTSGEEKEEEKDGGESDEMIRGEERQKEGSVGTGKARSWELPPSWTPEEMAAFRRGPVAFARLLELEERLADAEERRGRGKERERRKEQGGGGRRGMRG